MIAAMDEGIGNVTKALQDNDMLDNTIIIYTSDVRFEDSIKRLNLHLWDITGLKAYPYFILTL